MPEPTFDPIRELENLDLGGLGMTPLEPSTVRRLGDRRRTRRNAALVAASVVAVVAAATPVALLAGRGDPDGAPAPAVSAPPSPTASTPAPSPTPTQPQVITFPGDGVNVATPADAAKLTGTSSDFQAFIAAQAQKATSCPDGASGITVRKYSSAGYASGVNVCGGYVALWTRYHGAWGEGQATQDTWDCDALTFLQVPRAFAGDCADESGSFGLHGAGEPEPGMTRTEAEAAGVQVTTDAAAPPCVSTQYAAPVVPADDTRGLFSPHDGLVQVAMTAAMKTEERVGLGTPRSAVLAAYPGGHAAADNLWLVPRPGGTAYLIRFGTDDRVMRFTWQLNAADCADYLP